MAAAHRRVLIDWDWGAHGIWTILSAEELAAPATGGLWLSHKTPASEDGRHPWSDWLSPGLLEALQDWNDRGARLFDYARPDEPCEQELVVFRSQAAELAAWTQRALGLDYEVLFVADGGAWQWVDPPWSRAGPR